MFFEINNTIQDSNKLSCKRLNAEDLLIDSLKNSMCLEELDDNTLFLDDSFLIVKLEFLGVEEFCETNFSF